MTKINWFNGKTANSASDMQKLCDTVNRSLLTPESAPADTKIVAVNNTNTQTMLNIGNGLSVENGTLKASSGSGSGEKLYLHTINIYDQNAKSLDVYLTIINKNINPINSGSLLRSFLSTLDFNTYQSTGYYSDMEHNNVLVCGIKGSNDALYLIGYNMDIDKVDGTLFTSREEFSILEPRTVTDYVVEI